MHFFGSLQDRNASIVGYEPFYIQKLADAQRQHRKQLFGRCNEIQVEYLKDVRGRMTEEERKVFDKEVFVA